MMSRVERCRGSRGASACVRGRGPMRATPSAWLDLSGPRPRVVHRHRARQAMARGQRDAGARVVLRRPTQAQRLGPRDAMIATATLTPGSLQRMVRCHHRVNYLCETRRETKRATTKLSVNNTARINATTPACVSARLQENSCPAGRAVAATGTPNKKPAISSR